MRLSTSLEMYTSRSMLHKAFLMIRDLGMLLEIVVATSSGARLQCRLPVLSEHVRVCLQIARRIHSNWSTLTNLHLLWDAAGGLYLDEWPFTALQMVPGLPSTLDNGIQWVPVVR